MSHRDGYSRKSSLAIITPRKSDFSVELEKRCRGFIRYIHPDDLKNHDLSHYTAIAVLGGAGKDPFVLSAESRSKLETCLEAGTRVFCEYVSSIADVYSADPVSTRFSRMVYCGSDCGELKRGDILEEQSNVFISPYFSRSRDMPWLVRCESLVAHSHAEITEDMTGEIKNRALWMERPNLLVCSFKMANPVKARFSPYAGWNALFARIVAWLTEGETKSVDLPRSYWLGGNAGLPFEDRVAYGVETAMRWFEESGILLDNGKAGVKEGFGTEIDPDGCQKRAETVRTDCAGEVSLAFLSDYLLTGNHTSLETADNLESFCFDRMQIKKGPFRGMLRWTEAAWNVCYQDDAARAMIPSLLKMLYLHQYDRLPECCEALDFLLKTTGTDGLRPSRTDNLFLTPAEGKRLASTPAEFPSAHYNAFYHAALLLCGKMAGRKDYIEVGERGLESIMTVYPNTSREQSETEELCRLVMPLSILWHVTQKPRHRDWLYRVVRDLQRFRHRSGAYLEWDSGYSAACSRKENAECSMLTQNGDPVVDLLYSQNWLPIGFFTAWQVTGDPWFYQLWKSTVTFLLDAQIRSDNRKINGAWARGLDADRMEIYGLPNDVGWGPWAIESGWTVAEITAGIALGLYGHNPFSDSPPQKT